jgi:hypothetical protein
VTNAAAVGHEIKEVSKEIQRTRRASTKKKGGIKIVHLVGHLHIIFNIVQSSLSWFFNGPSGIILLLFQKLYIYI